MRPVLLPLLVCLLLNCGLAQQAKPSPAIRKVDTAELKAPAKPDVDSKPAAVQTLPVGTPIRMKLETPLYSATNKAGDSFAGRVLEDIKLNDKVVISVGSSLQGHITRVSDPRRIKGHSMIQLRPEWVVLPNGQKYAISAAVADTGKANETDVDDEGRIKGPGHSDRDVMEMGAGAGGGAIVGAVIAGGKGSLIGAGIGAGAAIAHWLTKRNSAYLPAGTEIIFELSHPVTLATND